MKELHKNANWLFCDVVILNTTGEKVSLKEPPVILGGTVPEAAALATLDRAASVAAHSPICERETARRCTTGDQRDLFYY